MEPVSINNNDNSNPKNEHSKNDKNPNPNENDHWALIEAYFTDYSPVQQQIDSCDKFFDEFVQRIVENIPETVVRDKFKRCTRTFRYGQCMTERMTLPGYLDSEKENVITPQICRLRDISYTCTLYAIVNHKIRYDDGKVETYSEKVEIGEIPIMVKSKNCVLYGLDHDELIKRGECPYDVGGYFILGGKERALVAQERLSYNQLFIFPDKQGLKGEIRCHCEETDQQSTVHLKYSLSKKLGPCIRIVVPHIHELKGVLLFAIFMVLGIQNIDEMIRMILYPCYDDISLRDQLEGSIAECESVNTRDKAIAYLSQFVKPRVNYQIIDEKHRKEELRTMKKMWLIYVIDKELFPHLHPDQSKEVSEMQNQSNVNVMNAAFLSYITGPEYRKRCLEKAWFLAYCVNRLLRVALERDPSSDRDAMAHKRLNLAGPLLAQLFKKKMLSQHLSMVKIFSKHINANKEVTVAGVMKQVDVTKGLSFSLKTGNWSGAKTNPTSAKQQGVSQVLNRMNYVAPLSHLRRTSASDTNLSVVRQLHNTQFALCCPSETPEGASCGVVKNLANMCHITNGSRTHLVYEWLNDKANLQYVNVLNLDVNISQGCVWGWKIFVNGKYIGISPEASMETSCFKNDGTPCEVPNWVHEFRKARSHGPIDYQVSISTHASNRKEIFIFTDEGRFSRPLLVIDNHGTTAHGTNNHGTTAHGTTTHGTTTHETTQTPNTKGKLLLTKEHIEKVKMYLNPRTSPLNMGWSWDDLVKNHIVEYIDAAESESIMIADFPSNITPHHSHCEIHPSMILGVTASLISYPNFSQAPRNTYQAAMSKQALGVPTLNFNSRYETTNYILNYPQTPLVRTKMHDILNTTALPSGQCVIVAVVEFTGYNQEDSIILNQAFVDRGGGRCRIDKTYKAEAKKHKIFPDDKFEKPNKEETMGMKKGNYEKLDVDGIIEVGVRVVKGDIIAGITGPIPTFTSFSRTRSYNKSNTQRVSANVNPNMTKKDKSLPIKIGGVVDSVMISDNGEQTTMAKIRVRTTRIPKIGDKFAASTGQKGTVGLVLKQQDMPYVESDGMVPDIIMNPHAFPSRMTVNQWIEMLQGTGCADEWEIGDSTPFNNGANVVDVISERLKQRGFDPKGEHYMINGQTGQRLKAKVFIGPAYYQRLKHMVDDKKHSRSKGPHNQLTRQPVEGRLRDGGLRVGEMEKDTLIAHGAAQNLQEMLMNKSDKFVIPVCERCGLLSEAKIERNINYCRLCNNMDSTSHVNIPYACKLLFQELMSMLVVPKLKICSTYSDDSLCLPNNPK